MPKSFTPDGASSQGLLVSIPIHMDRPVGRVLLYAPMSGLNTLMKVKDQLQHCFLNFF